MRPHCRAIFTEYQILSVVELIFDVPIQALEARELGGVKQGEFKIGYKERIFCRTFPGTDDRPFSVKERRLLDAGYVQFEARSIEYGNFSVLDPAVLLFVLLERVDDFREFFSRILEQCGKLPL